MKANELNLTLFFRLIVCAIFQPMLKSYLKAIYPMDTAGDYDNIMFFCPRVYAVDGWNVSLQIHNGNYCSTENGYRQFGFTYTHVEWGFTSGHEPMLSESAEEPSDTTDTVGSVDIEHLEQVFIKHGGIDWEQTLSVEHLKTFMKL